MLVSTDKAVAPATVMGASKALAEWAVEAADRALSRTPRSRPCGSATCSARPARWCRSSAARSRAGGPVTVTDPEMTRFFMTIPEAVQLVIRSGSLAARRRGVRARDGRARCTIMDLATRHDPVLQARAGQGHRDRDRRRAPGREAARGAVQPVRAAGAHAGGQDPARRAAARSTPRGSRRRSARSACSCSRATPPRWPPRSAELAARPGARRAGSGGPRSRSPGDGAESRPRRPETAGDRVAS